MSIARDQVHDSAHLHVTGAACYVDDIPTPESTVHLAFGLADIACGTVESLNVSAVRQADGVVAVLRAKDLPFANDVSPVASPEPLLSKGRVEFHGQPLFLVVAETHLQARKAARLAKVRYREEKPVLSIAEAMAAKSYMEEPCVFIKGDAAQAIDRAPRSLSGTMEIGGQEHFYLESQAALAVPQEGEQMEVHSSTQHPSEVQHKVADALGVPLHQVRVCTRRMGGGFGGKESQANALAIACAVVARRLGRVASMRYDRDDDMRITGKRHDFRIDYRVGFDDKGCIQGIDFQQYVRCGFSEDLSKAIADRAMFHADNAYHLPHARITSYRLRTNTVSNTAFRGFGGPQGMVGIERVMDHIAHSLGRDPLAIRRANFYAPALSRGSRQTTPYHMEVEDSVIHALVDELEQSSDYQTRREAVRAWNADSPVVKKGIALTPVKFGISFTLTHLNQAGALVHVYQDGSVQINHGGTEMGQGLYVKTAQIAANEFGIPLEKVKISTTDTSKVPNTSATAASSGSDLNGMAIKRACETLVARLKAFWAEKHDCSPEEVRIVDGKVCLAGEQHSFAEVVKRAYQARISLSANGFYATPKISWDRGAGRGRPFYYFAYGAACSEVVVDTLSGENRLLRSDLLLDAGKSLNPAIDIGQLEGGFVQGAGWLTTEELVWDHQGRLCTHAPATYKIPACSCRPRRMSSALWQAGENREQTVYRSKAVGEPPLMLGISVLMALSDALCAASPSFPALNSPATPERLLMALQEAKR